MDWYREIVDHVAQHKQALAFCAANGLHAEQIPAVDGLRIRGDVIHYRVFDPKPPAVSGWRTTPMVSTPKDHGLATRGVVALGEITRRLADAGAPPELAAKLAAVVQDIIATEVS